MKKIVTLTAAAALVVAFGFTGTARAEVVFPFDGDLVGYWHLDTNAAAADAVDGSVNSNVGSLDGGAIRSTDIPVVINNVNSVLLDGIDNEVKIGDDDALDVAGDLTLAAWVKRASTDAAGEMNIVGKWGFAVTQRSYELFFRNDKLVAFISEDGGSSVDLGATTTGTFTDTADWHHIAVVFSPSVSDVKIYFDGVQQTAGISGPATSIHVGTADVFIGSNDGVNRFLDGKIDEVRIYDVALTGLEVAALATAGAIVVNDDDADGSPPCRAPDFDEVQDGIDAVSDELKTVLVCPGTYVEDNSPDGNLQIFTNGVTLVGDDMVTSIIESATVHETDFPDCDDPPIDLQANGVTIDNLTINLPVNDTDERTCGLIIDGINNEVSNNYFNVGIGADFSVAIQTWGVTMLGAPIGSEGLGDVSGLHIHDNNFTNLPSLNGGRYIGVFINPQSEDEDADNDVLIEHNVLSGSMFFGIAVARGNTEVAHNQVDGAAAGVLLDVPGGEGDEANSVHNNSIGHSTFAGILITSDDNVVFRNSTHHTTGEGEGGGDGIQVSGNDNIFEGNNSHHNEDNAYENNGTGNCFDDTGKDRNKAKHNDGSNAIAFGGGGAASCP